MHVYEIADRPAKDIARKLHSRETHLCGSVHGWDLRFYTVRKDGSDPWRIEGYDDNGNRYTTNDFTIAHRSDYNFTGAAYHGGWVWMLEANYGQLIRYNLSSGALDTGANRRRALPGDPGDEWKSAASDGKRVWAFNLTRKTGIGFDPDSVSATPEFINWTHENIRGGVGFVSNTIEFLYLYSDKKAYAHISGKSATVGSVTYVSTPELELGDVPTTHNMAVSSRAARKVFPRASGFKVRYQMPDLTYEETPQKKEGLDHSGKNGR